MHSFKGSNFKTPPPEDTEVPTMSYDEPGLLEHDIGDTSYRFDAGKQGTALAVSTRPVGTWDWQFFSEMKWDGRTLKCRALDYATLKELSFAFREALADLE